MHIFSTGWYRQQCKNLRMRPERIRGQHFLTDRRIASRIADAAQLTPQDTAFEIGPGFGILTHELISRAGRVVAVETEKKFTLFLQESLITTRDNNNLTIVTKDALAFDEAVLPEGYVLVSNLPYSISTPIIGKFLFSLNPPSRMVIMLQKEVVERIRAKPPRMNRLALEIQLYGAATKIMNVPPQAFYPPPRVASAVVRIERHTKGTDTFDVDALRALITQGFSSPRRTLANNLARILKDSKGVCARAGISPERRPETLTLNDWMLIARYSQSLFN